MTRTSSPSTEKYIDVYTQTLKSILDDSLNFSIPYNQRPWAWDDKKLKILWDDIKKTHDDFYEKQNVNDSNIWVLKPNNNDIDPHFFGAFVFVETEDIDNQKILEVVDGQQRLTSLTMLASIIRELRTELGLIASSASQRSKAQTSIAESLKWLEKNGAAIIKADEQYLQLYNALVITPSSQNDRDSLVNNLAPIEKDTKEHARLINSFKFLRKLIIDDCKNMGWEEKFSFLESTLNTLGDRFIVISSYIKIESFSYRVFTALNAKGQKLTPTDNIKNELFNLSRKQLHPNISQLWRAFKANTLKGNIGDFLRKRLIANSGKIFSSDSLYETIHEKELKISSNIVTTLNKWSNDAKLLKDIFNSTHSSSDINTRHIVDGITTLNISLCEIMIFKAANLFLPHDKASFIKVAKLTLNLAFRKITITGDKTSDLEKAYADAAKNLDANPISIQNVINIFRNYSDDGEFKKRFAIHTQQNSKIQYYILFEIEKHLAGTAGLGLQPYPHSVNQHIEHILPKKISTARGRDTEWQWARNNPTLHKTLINRLGNLLILESSINTKVSNHEFKSKQTGFYLGSLIKKVGYIDSTLQLPAKLADPNSFSQWGENEIDQRQSYLADLALKIWDLQ